MNKKFEVYMRCNEIIWAVAIVGSAILLRKDVFKIIILLAVCAFTSERLLVLITDSGIIKEIRNQVIIWIGAIIASAIIYGRNFFQLLLPGLVSVGISFAIFLPKRKWVNYNISNGVLWAGIIIGSSLLLGEAVYSKIATLLVVCAVFSIIFLPLYIKLKKRPELGK